MTKYSILANLLAVLILVLSPTLLEKEGGFLHYEFQDNEISVESRLGEAGFSFRFAPVGPNHLMAIKEIGLYYGDETYLTKAATDYVGPYIVSDDEVGSAKEDFTGGWHSRGEEGEKEPTAKMREYSLIVDGEKREEETGLTAARRVELQVVNEILAYNSTRPVIEERVNYRFRPAGVDVDITVRALKPVTIKTYYGFQAQKPSWAEELLYHYEDGSKEAYALDIDSSSQSIATGNPVSKVEWRAPHLPLSFIMSMARNSPYSGAEYVDKNLPWAFSKAYGKSYFNIVHGRELKLDEGEEILLKGSYYFKEQKNEM